MNYYLYLSENRAVIVNTAVDFPCSPGLCGLSELHSNRPQLQVQRGQARESVALPRDSHWFRVWHMTQISPKQLWEGCSVVELQVCTLFYWMGNEEVWGAGCYWQPS